MGLFRRGAMFVSSIGSVWPALATEMCGLRVSQVKISDFFAENAQVFMLDTWYSAGLGCLKNVQSVLGKRALGLCLKIVQVHRGGDESRVIRLSP